MLINVAKKWTLLMLVSQYQILVLKLSLIYMVSLSGDPLKHEYTTLQSLTGKYRGLQGNPCNENRDPAMRTGVPCNENRFFLVGIGSQGVPCELYRVWVCSAVLLIGAAFQGH